MDPLSALSVGSNILGVIDFTWTLLTDSCAIYKSPSGQEDEARSIESIVRDIHHLNDTLSPSFEVTAEFQNVLSESRTITSELLSALQALKGPSQPSKWPSIAVALKEGWGKDKLRGLVNKLEALQTQIIKHIQVATRYLSHSRRYDYKSFREVR